MILLVASNKDPAGMNISNRVIQLYPFTKTAQIYQENPVYTATIYGKQVTHIILNEEAVNTQYLPESFPNADLIVFISRHSSQSGTPTLSVHTPGNFGAAELGGLSGELSVSPAVAMQNALQTLHRLKEQMKLDYQVSYECTHHGPSLHVPTMFVELGSSYKQWVDQQAAAVVAQAAVEAIANFGDSRQNSALGIGGTHYNQKFTNMALRNEAVFGHMIPKYAIQKINLQIIKQCVMRTQEKVDAIILDWKGIKSEDKPTLLKVLQEIGLPIQKV
jgi:D-aminoacyl-tRNA deacylase